MSDTYRFALAVLLTAAVGLLALLSNRLTERLRVPAPLWLLVTAAVAVKVIPSLHAPPGQAVQKIVTLGLIAILFDGGQHIGWGRFRSAAGPIAVVGVVGTFLTAAGAASLLHLIFGVDWYLSALVGTAIAPTDPAVVFSVLGNREIAGRSGTILEGESGANDPVGIALMTGLLAAGGLGGGALGQVAVEFALQMGIGGAIGIIGGRALLRFMRAVALPSEALYPLRAVAGAAIIFGIATLAHGSGFLAVFVAGISIGDERAPYKREIERFSSALASLGEMAAFVVLGLTVDIGVLSHRDVWLPGLALGVLLAVVVRPVVVGACLMGARLQRNERRFVLFAGLKGAVPILLANLLLINHVAQAERLYGVVVVVVVLSVAVQGALVPTMATRQRLPMRTVAPEPWAFGVRLGEEPRDVHRVTVGVGAPADGRRIEELDDLPEDAWISLAVREAALLPIRSETVLQSGDEVVVLAPAEREQQLRATFVDPADGSEAT